MAKGNQACNDLIKFYAQGIAMPSYGGNWELHLHTADPGDGGTGASNETTYTGYAPILIVRDSSGWGICDADGTPNTLGRAFKNLVEGTFAECSGVSDDQLITHVSLTAPASDQIIYKGALPGGLSIRVTYLVTPRIPIGAAIFKER
jgi:hypothetical protein